MNKYLTLGVKHIKMNITFLFLIFLGLQSKQIKICQYNVLVISMYGCPIVLITSVWSKCPNDLCNAVYSNRGAVFRVDDGDLVIPDNASSLTCSSIGATCVGTSCHSCKCRSNQNTFNNHKERCENFDKSKDKIIYILHSHGLFYEKLHLISMQ